MAASLPSVEGSSKRDWSEDERALGKLTGMTRSVPAIVVSMVNLTVKFEKETTWK